MAAVVVAVWVLLLPGTVGPAESLPPLSAAPSAVLVWQHRYPEVVFRESSPVRARLGSTAVVVGGQDGNLYAFDLVTGVPEPGWPVRTSNPINSSPAAADLTGTGRDEVFVGSGYGDAGTCSGGGVYAADFGGRVLWHNTVADPNCVSLAVHSSPVVGDITGRGIPDVTIGTLGLRAPSYEARTGRLNQGWPYNTDDTVFSSPALAQLDDSGVPLVVMGGDSSPGGLIDHRGGVVRAIRGDGHTVWQFLTDEMVRSSPAIGDLDGHGRPTIVFGTGNYWSHQPGGSKDGNSLFALTDAGALRWRRDLGALTIGSPALADVAGTGHADVVIGTADGAKPGTVWVLDGNGNPLPHWAGHPSGGGVVIGGITTADINGDGAQDLLVPTGRGVFVYDGRTGGLLMTLALNQVGFQSSPLVTDDGLGILGVTTAGTTADGIGVVQHWALSPLSGARVGNIGWPQFHHDARHTGNLDPPPVSRPKCAGRGVDGYWLAAGDGGVFGYCGAAFHGSPSAVDLRKPVMAMVSSPSGHGYWLASADGGVLAYGDAPYLGSVGSTTLTRRIVGMARTPSGKGYWLASQDGGVFAFGDAPYLGSAGGVRLPLLVVGIVPTTSGLGYWLMGAEGTILTYGDAPFYGSPTNVAGRSSIVAAARTPSGLGYWLVGADGGVFTYGDAAYLGSTSDVTLRSPIVAMAPTAAGRGYWLVAADGGVFTFGDAPFLGSPVGRPLNQRVSSLAIPSS